MPEKVFGPLVTGDEIKQEIRKRTLKVDKKTITASKWSLVMAKVAIEEQEGWIKLKKNKKSYGVFRPKQPDEKLEDEMWCILANMGFSEMSLGRNFQIETKSDPNPRQIDIFAKDDEVALIIECTQRKQPMSSNRAKIYTLIDKISEFKDEISKSITGYYGHEIKIKPKFIIATRNIEWGDADKEKCKNKGICVLPDTEIDYYKALTNHLKTAARFQFLAHVFAGVEIPGLLKKAVPATKGSMGKVNFYNFLIEPNELLKIAYVGHWASRSIDSDMETYQRMLQPKRLKEIASFIDHGGKFPTNIVINIKTGNRKLSFESSSPKNEARYGVLKLPQRYASAWVIDGQHRLYGYAYRDMEKGPKNDKSVLSVLAFENLPPKDEMDMFIDINSKQVKVKKSLLIELYADLHWNSPDIEERILALQARIVSRLNSLKTSPLSDRVVLTGKRKTAYRCLTATSLSDGIKHSQLLGSVKKSIFYPGPLSHHDPDKFDKSLTKASSILSQTLQIFADAMPNHWKVGDKPGEGYLYNSLSTHLEEIEGLF